MTRWADSRRVTVLCLYEAERALLEQAVRQLRPSNGAGEYQIRKALLEMLSSAQFSPGDLDRFRELAG